MKKILLTLLALILPLAAAWSYPPKLPDAREEVYSTVGEKELKVWIFGESDPEKPKPAIVFFFGGGWNGGSPEQFSTQARHFAERGMIAMVADYRVKSRDKVKPVACATDGKACVAWIRENSERLGIISDKICASGGSAGGHVAACAGTIPGLGNEERPNAMILFNPVSLLADLGKWKADFGSKRDLGIESKLLSPPHHVGDHTPPTLIMHGTGDTTVNFKTAQAFEDAMKKANRPVTLIAYPDQAHGFFNRGDSYKATLAEADKFLVSLGWIQ